MLLGAPTTATALLAIDAPATYTPGDVLTITLQGDSEGRASLSMVVELTFEETLEVAGRSAGTLEDSSAGRNWIRTSRDLQCGAAASGLSLAENQCIAVDAAETYGPLDLLPSTLSTWQFDTTNASGDLVFLLDPWDREGVSHDHFFFGFPGTQITVAMIPEPSAGLLLCLGLATLAWKRLPSAGQLRCRTTVQ
jgi:hypothetical protein